MIEIDGFFDEVFDLMNNINSEFSYIINATCAYNLHIGICADTRFMLFDICEVTKNEFDVYWS